MNNNRETEQKGQIPSLDNKKDKVGLAKNEIRVALIIILLSIIVVIEALQMPVPRSWNSAPGLFPFVLGVSLIVMSAILIYGILKENKQINIFENLKSITLSNIMNGIRTDIKNNLRIIIVISFVAIYYFVLINVVPFEIATAVYIFLSLSFFWKEGKLSYKIIISILIPLFLMIMFKELFKVILPGISILDLL